MKLLPLLFPVCRCIQKSEIFYDNNLLIKCLTLYNKKVGSCCCFLSGGPSQMVLFVRENEHQGEDAMTMTIKSPAFFYKEEIPPEYTCDGLDVSPPLEWSGVPEQAKSLVLIVEDPDAPDPAAPKMTWVHWVLYNLPPTTTSFKQGITRTDLPPGTREGINDWQQKGYGGPCPPIGRHRYFFKLFALDTILEKLEEPTTAQLTKAMAGHVLDQAELIGLYQR
jgi:Raf kinase inhibitor-like YbhB/YbcL family protein